MTLGFLRAIFLPAIKNEILGRGALTVNEGGCCSVQEQTVHNSKIRWATGCQTLRVYIFEALTRQVTRGGLLSQERSFWRKITTLTTSASFELRQSSLSRVSSARYLQHPSRAWCTTLWPACLCSPRPG